ncbi:transmembrane protein 267 isoform X2 [Coccinella septempunctata]|uniref:transmembrane protein 267 isoform X2 n=1 Tax=Coccinella septempunctata TaxID=41139 RepID=UPI001D073FDD|nr:transmembrane protein 267 isoform X2 [Coccinella septempunctata]
MKNLFSFFIKRTQTINAVALLVAEATNLKERPFLHSTTVPIVTCACFYLCGNLWKSAILKRLTPVIFIAFSSHHIRDATRRGLWFSPFGSTAPIPYKLYISLNCAIPLVISFLLNKFGHHIRVQYTVFVV